MNIRQFFRATIPGYAFLIPLVFYFPPAYLGKNFIPVIAATIAAGIPFGTFIEWITQAILHFKGHPVILPRIKEIKQVLSIPIEEDSEDKGSCSCRQTIQHQWNLLHYKSRENQLRGLLNFVLHSDKEGFKSHLDRWSFLASRTSSILGSIYGIALGNISGIIILIIRGIKGLCLYQIFGEFPVITICVSILVALPFSYFYRICRDDLIAYESMLIRRYRAEIRTAGLFISLRG